MKNSMMFYLRLMALLCLGFFLPSATAQEKEAPKLKQFIYVLHLVPRLYADTAWTKEDEAVIEKHINNFKEATKRGQCILVGRTMEPGDRTFGIAVFEATDEATARAFMQSDPAVAGGLMTAELHPFAVVLQRKNP